MREPSTFRKDAIDGGKSRWYKALSIKKGPGPVEHGVRTSRECLFDSAACHLVGNGSSQCWTPPYSPNHTSTHLWQLKYLLVITKKALKGTQIAYAEG